MNLSVFPPVKEVDKCLPKNVKLFLIYNIIYCIMQYIHPYTCKQSFVGFICCYLVPSAKPNPKFWFIIHFIKNSDWICIFNERVSHIQSYRINTPLWQSIKNKLFSPIRCKIHEALLNDKVVWSHWEAGSVGLQFQKNSTSKKNGPDQQILLHCVVTAPHQVCSSPALSSGILMDCGRRHLFSHFDTLFDLWLRGEQDKKLMQD